ncbi:MAG: putative zinc-binding protein [Armatimonadota bacterium]
MAEQDRCCCTAENATVLACSGGSNVGQITNEVAKRLDQENKAKFFCLAGVGGHISGMGASVKGCERVLVLDGCPVGCAKATMEAAGLDDYEYVVVTELGIEKNHDFTLNETDVDNVLKESRSRLSGGA